MHDDAGSFLSVHQKEFVLCHRQIYFGGEKLIRGVDGIRQLDCQIRSLRPVLGIAYVNFSYSHS